MPRLQDTVGTPTLYSTLDLERENVHFESIPAQNDIALAVKQQKPPRELEPLDLWESSSSTKIAKPKWCYRMNRRFCLQELKNARAIWVLFGRNSLRAQTYDGCVWCAFQEHRFEQNRKPTEFGFALVCQYLVSWTLSERAKYELSSYP